MQHFRALLTEMVQAQSQIQLATAELLRSGNDAVTVASGAGLPEHIAGLLANPKEQKSAVEALLNSPVMATALTAMAQALKPKEAPK